MKIFNVIIVFLLVAFCVPTMSQESPIEITGFGDIYYIVQPADDGIDDFNFGQVELDVETSIQEKVFVSAAIALDPESRTFGLGAFTVDLHIFGNDGNHFRRGGLDHSGVILGLFDVPFGIDWQVYPSIDRKLVSSPLVVENTHDSWNDCGVQGYLEHGRLGVTLFVTNGTGYEIGYDASGAWLGYNNLGYNNTNPIITTDAVEMTKAIGGHLGIKPHDLVEIGLSYAGFLDQDDQVDMSLTGIDIQFHYNDLHCKGEYIVHDLGLNGDNEISNSGFYAQGWYEFSSVFIVGRYDMFSPDIASVEEFNRLSIGFGWVIIEGVGLRVEHQINSEEDSDVSFFQTVVAF